MVHIDYLYELSVECRKVLRPTAIQLFSSQHPTLTMEGPKTLNSISNKGYSNMSTLHINVGNCSMRQQLPIATATHTSVFPQLSFRLRSCTRLTPTEIYKHVSRSHDWRRLLNPRRSRKYPKPYTLGQDSDIAANIRRVSKHHFQVLLTRHALSLF